MFRNISGVKGMFGVKNLGRALGALLLAGASTAALATTTINQQYTAATIDPGDTSHFKITVLNTSLAPLTAAKVTVLLVGQVTIAATPAISNGCGFTVTQAASGTSTLELTGGAIPAGNGTVDGQCTFQIDVTATAAGNWVSNIPANTTPNATTAGYTAKENTTDVFNTTLANATLSINTLSNPTGGKAFSPSPVKAGDPTTLTITLTNPNAASTIPLTTFTDTLPGNMVVYSTPTASTSCSGTGSANGVVTAAAASNTITLTGGTIGKSGACTISAKVVVPVTTNGSTTQSFDNILAAGAIGNTRGLTSPTFNTAVTVNTPIGVAKSFGTTLIAAGQASLMTIAIANNSTANALDITSFDDNLTGTTIKILNTASSPVAAVANPAVTCTGTGAVNGTLSTTADTLDTTLNLANAKAGPGGSCTITAYVTSSVDGAHVNTIAADAVANPVGHHSPTVGATLTANGQLTLNKTATLNNVAPGQWTQFTVTINNWSGGSISNVVFSDVLPINGADQMVLQGVNPVSSVGCTGGAWTGNDGDTTLGWTGGTVAAGVGASPGACVIVFKARLPGTATTGMNFSNQIPINGVTGTCNGVNCSVGNGNGVNNPAASSAVGIATIASGAVGKAFAPSTIAQGGTSTLTVTIYNRTLAALTNVSLTDTLPAGLTLAANPAATNSCGGTLQAFPGGNQLVLTGGTVAARPDASQNASCSFSAKVTGMTVGTHTNTLPLDALDSNEVTTSAAVSANLTISTGLVGAKTFTPASVTKGGTSRVKITVTNGSSGQLTNVSVDDNTFSADLTIANPANAATNCSGSPTMVVNPGQARAQLQGATLAAGASCDFSFDVLTNPSGGAGPWSNTVPIGNITSAEGPSNSATATASLTAVGASIGINKGFNPVAVTGGVASTLQIDVINPSAIAISGTGFTDTFPPGIEVYSVPNASTDCAGGMVTAIPGDGKVSLSGATLAASSTCHVYVQTTSVKFLNLTNTIPIGAISSNQGYTNALATTASLSTLQGLGVMKSFSPAYIVPNAISKLKLRLVSTFDSNAVTPITLTGVSFTDSLPAGMTVANPANASTDCTNGSVTANVGSNLVTITGATIVPGTNCNISVDITAGVLGAYNNTIPINAITTDQGVPNQSPASDTLYVVNKPTVSKTFSPTSVNVGVSSTLTVTITNNYASAVSLTGVSLSDSLPSGLFIASTPSASTTCSNGVVSAAPGTGTLKLSGASITAGTTCTFQANVVSNTPASYSNNIPASALVSTQGLTNPGPAPATLVVLPPASVSKVFSPASIDGSGAGVGVGISTLTITLGNSGAGAITLSSVLVDALPGNVFVHGTPNVVKTCAGVVTAAAGANSITYASGAAIPAGGCTISVNVTSTTCGSYTNTIAAGQLATSAGANQLPAVATLGVCQAAAPTLSKSFSPTTIDANATSTLTITLGNSNAAPVNLTALFTDTLPAGVVVAPAPSIGGTCTTGSITAGAGAGSVTYANGAAIPAGGCTITVAVTSATGGSYTNTIAAGALVTAGGSNPLPATATLVVITPQPPTIVESFATNVINPCVATRLTYTLGNPNASAITLNAPFTDTLPGTVVIANPANIGGSCTGTVTAAVGGNTVTYANGSTIPSGGCTIQVDVTSCTPGAYANPVGVGDVSTTGAGANAAGTSATLIVNPLQPPSVSKSFSPTSVAVNATSTLSIAFGNPNATPATLSADLVDNLPAGLVVAATPNIRVSTGCTLAKVAAAAGGASVTYQSGGAIPASGGCAIAVDVTSATTGVYSNTVTGASLQTSIGNGTVNTTATLTVSSKPTISKSFAPNNVLPNVISTLTLTLGNTNTVAATLAAALTDTFPGNLKIANPSGLAGACNLGNVTAVAGSGSISFANGASIPATVGCTIVVNVTSAADGTFVNTIPAGGLQTDRGNNPSPASATLTVTSPSSPPAGIPPTVSKAFSPATIAPGGVSLLTITLGNPNSGSMTATATFDDVLPAGVTIANPSGVTGSCNLAGVNANPGGGTVSYAAGSGIQVGGCTISVNVTAAAAGSYVNTIPAGELQTNTGGNPNPASATLTVVAPVPVPVPLPVPVPVPTTTPTTTPIPVPSSPPSACADVTTSISLPAKAVAGDTINAAITFANKGPGTATGLTFGATLSGVSGLTCSGAACSYDKASGAVTLEGLPTSAGSGLSATVTLTYTAPATGQVSVSSRIGAQSCQGANTAPDSAGGVTAVSPAVNKAPTGLGTGQVNNAGELVCTTTWVNNTNSNSLRIKVTGPIPAGTTYIPNSLVCQPHGKSSALQCMFDKPSNSVLYEGFIAPETGVVSVNSASNGVVITFRSTYVPGATCTATPSKAIYDKDGNGNLSDDVVSGQSQATANVVAANTLAVGGVNSVPALSPAGLALLMLAMGLLGLRQARRVR